MIDVWIIVFAVASAALALGLAIELRSARRLAAQSKAEADRAAGERSEALQAAARAEERAEHLLREKQTLSSLMAEREQEQERQRQESERRMREYVALQFKSIADDVLGEKSKQLHEQGLRSFEALQGEGLKSFESLQKDIKAFKERVESIHTEDTKQRSTLDGQIRALHELNRRMSDEAAGLTRALKGSNKVQGDWGEMILETILESSSLQKGVHYFPQGNFKNEQGDNLRPDFVLCLPDGKRVIIDSKVSLTAFVDYVGAEDDRTRAEALKRHLDSVRRHVDELCRKQYQNLPEMKGTSPDFVIMFIPNEPAFMAALQNDSSLWNKAYRSGVVISSPTNLFALLKIVDDLWKRDSQSRNALEIADRGAKLYDKFVGFVSTLEDVGKAVRSASAAYDKALGQLSEGRGSLVSQADSLRKLGVKAAKSLPQNLVDKAEEQ